MRASAPLASRAYQVRVRGAPWHGGCSRATALHARWRLEGATVCLLQACRMCAACVLHVCCMCAAWVCCMRAACVLHACSVVCCMCAAVVARASSAPRSASHTKGRAPAACRAARRTARASETHGSRRNSGGAAAAAVAAEAEAEAVAVAAAAAAGGASCTACSAPSCAALRSMATQRQPSRRSAACSGSCGDVGPAPGMPKAWPRASLSCASCSAATASSVGSWPASPPCWMARPR